MKATDSDEAEERKNKHKGLFIQDQRIGTHQTVCFIRSSHSYLWLKIAPFFGEMSVLSVIPKIITLGMKFDDSAVFSS